MLDEHAIDTRLPPRRRDDRRDRRRRRRCAGSSRTCAGRGRCCRRAASAGSSGSSFASSDKAYGAHDELPYREDFALQPTAPYEASKAAADLIARSYWHSYGLPVAVTRFANIYGGGDLNFSRLIPEAVSAAIQGRAPVLRSDGSPERDFLYVEDAASAYLAIADAARPRRRPRRGVQRRRRAGRTGSATWSR